jgi:hypothetical protein
MPLAATELSTKGSTPLAPRWSKAASGSIGSIGLSVRLASAANGGLWIFNGGAGVITAQRLNADGKVAGEQRIEQPAGETAASFPAHVNGISESALGPATVAQWYYDCPPPRGVTGEYSCAHEQVLVFTDDGTTPPIRIDSERIAPKAKTLGLVLRSREGDALFAPLSDGAPALFDLQGKVLWRRPLPSVIASAQLSDGTLWDSERSVIDVDGSLLQSVRWATEGPDLHGVMLRAFRDGRAPVAEEYLLPENTPLLLGSTSLGRLELDTRGRKWMIDTNVDSDIVLVRCDDNISDAFVLRREEYLDLHATGSAVDPAGTLHVSFVAGGRSRSEQRQMLCSFPMDGAPSCLTLADFLGQLEAPAAGVIYGISGAGLTRYEL